MQADEREHEHTIDYAERRKQLVVTREMLRFEAVRAAVPRAEDGLFPVRGFGRIFTDVPTKVVEAILSDRDRNQQFFGMMRYFNLALNNAEAGHATCEYDQCAVKGAVLAAIAVSHGANVCGARLLENEVMGAGHDGVLRIEVRVAFASPPIAGADNYRESYSKLMEILAQADAASHSSGRPSTSNTEKFADAVQVCFELVVCMEALDVDLRVADLPVVLPSADEAAAGAATGYETRSFLRDNQTLWIPASAVLRGVASEA